ncbi:MAG: bifunctional glutamate N-acetyltransferase/amino-acid acetyltransferase ArgJ [Isosphaeraceae bacterium]|nr:bifunctional glutamate N-acetyltransferase/amino-acid acetyltransferase ArgJ [Isosphaeraceae bacterium]
MNMSESGIPSGYRAAAVKAGIKASGNLDLALVVSDRPRAAAGTFTLNRIAAAPVQWDRARVPSASVRAIVVNAGNANAATGAEGLADVERTARAVAQAVGCGVDEVLVASTGVIGRRLPIEKLESGVRAAFERLEASPAAFEAASHAILTTDTRPKTVSLQAEIAGRPVRLFGFAKGAAMIGPRMATMLGFLFTDANVAPADLQAALSEAVERSFNCISVEGHTSTNDTVLLLAGGDGPQLAGDDLAAFAALVDEACTKLARMIPEDGEGATHLITIDVVGARDREEARTIARTVADSALVKTAIHGADPNWGRIVSAAGYSGVPFEESELSLELNGIPLYRDGVPLEVDLAAASASLRGSFETTILLTLRRGEGSIRFWTSDLTAEYVRLNADYTT